MSKVWVDSCWEGRVKMKPQRKRLRMPSDSKRWK